MEAAQHNRFRGSPDEPGVVGFGYIPEVDQEQAPVLDLDEQPELKIAATSSPAALPADVLGRLNSRRRLSYLFTTKTPGN